MICSPQSCPSPSRKDSAPTSRRVSCSPPGPQPHGLVSLPDHRIVQTSQAHPPSLPAPRSLPPQPLQVHSFPKCNPLVTLYGVPCPSPGGCEYMPLINCCQPHLTRVRYPVPSKSLEPSGRNFSFTYEMKRRWIKQGRTFIKGNKKSPRWGTFELDFEKKKQQQ